MNRKEVLFDFVKINIAGVILSLAAVVVVCGAVILFGYQDISYMNCSIWLMLLLIISITCIHELLHGIGFRFWGRTAWNEIQFGVKWKYLCPYCTCSAKITRSTYIKSILLPNVIISMFFLVAAFISPNLFWAVFAGLMIGTGTGDFIMLHKVMQFPKGTLFQDHPSKPGFFVYLADTEGAGTV